MLRLFPDLGPVRAEALRRELLGNDRLGQELNRRLLERRRRKALFGGEKEFLYMAVRLGRPRIVFETGVFDGESSAVILQALHDNDEGVLVSVDLPAFETIKGSTHLMPETALPPGCEPGWAIPEYLKERHRLILGDSKEQLPSLFTRFPTIDMFFHDSLHTLEHQYFEYTTAWEHLSNGGLLVSDDIFWSPAFYRFCKEKARAYLRLGDLGVVTNGERR
jgi:predicted O-methyltransferase YrrM